MNGKKTINLALQGGGAHGAYTWGVLDRLLQETQLEIEGISGTSAGAMNAAVMADGLRKGGAEQARKQLATFWHKISELGTFTPFNLGPYTQAIAGWNLDWTPAYQYFDLLSRLISPYDLNPFNLNPLRQVLLDTVDFELLRSDCAIKLFATATHVATGTAKPFSHREITADVLIASACIPFFFQAVEIEGEHYWDGGYMGNPALWPLIYHCDSEDIVLVQINPLHRNELPKTAGEIINRLNEISFNSSLIAEMRAIDFVSRLILEGRLSREEYKDVKMHLIYSAEEIHELNASSKLNVSFDFFTFLHDRGYAAADQWLKQNWEKVGSESSVDIQKKFMLHGSDARKTGWEISTKKRKAKNHK